MRSRCAVTLVLALVLAAVMALQALGEQAASKPFVPDTSPLDVPQGADVRHKMYEFDYKEVVKAEGTCVYGNINSAVRWTKAKSPYIVCERLYVLPKASLTIEPGVTVKFLSVAEDTFRGNALGLAVYGKMSAQGTPESPIRFTSYSYKDYRKGWDFIQIVAGEPSIFTWATFEYARTPIECRSSCFVAHCVFRNCASGVYLLEGEATVVTSNVFANGYNGVDSNGTASTCYVTNNIFYLNTHGIVQFNKGNIVADYNLHLPLKTYESNVNYQGMQPGKHDVLKDPSFVDPAKADFRLNKRSPARGAGSGGIDMGLDSENWSAESARSEIADWLAYVAEIRKGK